MTDAEVTESSTDTHAWSESWPTEPGPYWFYGRTFDRGEIRMRTIDVRGAVNCLVYIDDNGIPVYECNGAKGVWLPQEIPKPPRVPEEFWRKRTTPKIAPKESQ